MGESPAKEREKKQKWKREKRRQKTKQEKLGTELRNFHRGKSKRKQTSQPFAPKKWKNAVPV